MAVFGEADQAVISENIGFDNTNPTEADFQGVCSSLALYSTADVHVAFDSAANSGSFFIPATTVVELDPIKFTRVSALGDAGSGTLYLLARR